MGACWTQRGCDKEMQAECPHSNELADRCPAKCAFAFCVKPSYIATADPELIFSTEVDRETAIKETCMSCAFFLRNGPRLDG